MPTYSYFCEGACGPFDSYQPFTAETLTACPKCGGAVRKVFTPPVIHYPGRRFMDYADKAAERDAKHPVKRGQWAVTKNPSESP